MVNYSTPPEQLMKELLEEDGKAVFWLKKHYHGEKGYERMRDRLIEESNMTGKDKISDIVEYISRNGNRWLVFECCRYYKGAGYAYAMPVAFCYYETYGSVGAYVVGYNAYVTVGTGKTIIHFTNHFFLRFCQRLGVEMRSRWMVQRFVEVIPGFLFGYNGKDENGRDRFDVRLPGSIGRGIMREDAPIIEVRTYLTDKELSRKQLRETERLREAYDRQTFEPIDVRMVRLWRSSDFVGDMQKELENEADMLGIDKGIIIFAFNIRYFIAQAISDLGYIKNDDYSAWRRIGEAFARTEIMSFAQGYSEEGDHTEMFRMLFRIIAKVGELANIRGYDTVAVMNKTIERWQEAANRTNKEDNDGKRQGAD